MDLVWCVMSQRLQPRVSKIVSNFGFRGKITSPIAGGVLPWGTIQRRMSSRYEQASFAICTGLSCRFLMVVLEVCISQVLSIAQPFGLALAPACTSLRGTACEGFAKSQVRSPWGRGAAEEMSRRNETTKLRFCPFMLGPIWELTKPCGVMSKDLLKKLQ